MKAPKPRATSKTYYQVPILSHHLCPIQAGNIQRTSLWILGSHNYRSRTVLRKKSMQLRATWFLHLLPTSLSTWKRRIFLASQFFDLQTSTDSRTKYCLDIDPDSSETSSSHFVQYVLMVISIRKVVRIVPASSDLQQEMQNITSLYHTYYKYAMY